MFSRKELPYVLTDCDGTITMTDFSIQPETVKSILKYQKRSGYKFSFITGRIDIVNKKIASDLKIQLPIVSCNGALITDPNSGKVLNAEYIDKQIAVAVFREAFKLGLDVICYQPGSMVGTPESARIQAWNNYNDNLKNKKHKFKIITFDDLDQLANAIADDEVKPVELIIVANDEKTKEQMKVLFEQFKDKLDLVQSLPYMFNAMKKGVNKAYGLKKWAEIVGEKESENIVTFGDNFNDMEMIKHVKHGYAVGNAVKELQKAAFKTVETVEDNGVGKQLERIIEDEY